MIDHRVISVGSVINGPCATADEEVSEEEAASEETASEEAISEEAAAEEAAEEATAEDEAAAEEAAAEDEAADDEEVTTTVVPQLAKVAIRGRSTASFLFMSFTPFNVVCMSNYL